MLEADGVTERIARWPAYYTVVVLLCAAVFIVYLLTMFVSSTLANRYGGKLVLGVAVIWWSLFTSLTPPAALVSLPVLVMVRVALGVGEAAVFPAAINI